MNYIDTSVIVAALDPTDPRQKSAKTILEEERDKAISEIVLAELSSVLARREFLLDLKEKLDLREELIVPSLLLYLIKRFNLWYGKVNGYTKIPMLGELYSPISMAINLSANLKLKTLDLLHVAYAKLLKDKGKVIDTLITVDEEFKNVERTIEDMLDMKVRFLFSE